ncbi:MAG TPA: FadR family transcriptional regulator [Clostridiaceae bacterium]|nr:FadR family transcriptional regulator [Clostridiaceae bacterium]
MIEPVKKVMVHSKAAEIIEKYIHENGFKNGDKLPSEREMAKMLSIGRNSLREALRTLEAMNLIEVRNGRGVFVKDIDATVGINVNVTIAKVNFLELLDVRKTLEIRAIELAIMNGGKSDIDEIERWLLAIEDKFNKGVVPVNEDVQFHHAIYRAGHNRTLFELVRPLADTFNSLWKPFDHREELILETLSFHRPLFEAIKKRDTDAAISAFKRIIDIDEKKIANIYDSFVTRPEEK